MSKVITFSRFFPSYHPKAGQPTGFIAKMYASLADHVPGFKIPNDANAYWDWYEYYNCTAPKHHTIRSGHRWKVGDWFTPKVWGDDINPKSGRKGPYHSKQIQFAPDIQIKKIWLFRIDEDGCIFINGELYGYPNSDHTLRPLAANDGLEMVDMLNWFNEPMMGQIICWNESINY